MQYQVPQFIETEDTIIGPLTIRQFLFLSAAGIVTFFLFFAVATWLWIVLAILIIGSSIALALVRVNGQALPKIILSMFNFYWQPQEYLWQPENPGVEKSPATMQQLFGGGFNLEHIIYGIALKRAYHSVQTGQNIPEEQQGSFQRPIKERYEVIKRLGGERRAVKRIDYR